MNSNAVYAFVWCEGEFLMEKKSFAIKMYFNESYESRSKLRYNLGPVFIKPMPKCRISAFLRRFSAFRHRNAENRCRNAHCSTPVRKSAFGNSVPKCRKSVPKCRKFGNSVPKCRKIGAEMPKNRCRNAENSALIRIGPRSSN